MDIKKIGLALLLLTLFVGCAYAASGVNNFNVDKSYNQAYSGDYCAVYVNSNQNSGVAIYKNVDDDVYDDIEDDDAYDYLVHGDGREYVISDDDLKVDKNSDNTANFTDYEHATHGIVEVVNNGGEEFIVVFWAKDGGNVSDSDLTTLLNNFNKDNKVEAKAF